MTEYGRKSFSTSFGVCVKDTTGTQFFKHDENEIMWHVYRTLPLGIESYILILSRCRQLSHGVFWRKPQDSKHQVHVTQNVISYTVRCLAKIICMLHASGTGHLLLEANTLSVDHVNP